MTQASLLLSLMLLSGGDQASGDHIYRLENGTLAEGHIVRRGGRRLLQTPLGFCALSAQSASPVVAELAPVVAEYRGLVKQLNPKAQKEQIAIARWCLERGYLSGLRERLNAILHRDVDEPWARKTLERIANDFRLSTLDGSEKNRDQRRFIKELLRRVARRDNVGAVLVSFKLRKLPAKLRYRPTLSALRAQHSRVRWVAAQALKSHPDQSTRISPLLKRAISDSSAAVRRAASQALAATGDAVLVRILAKHLRSPKAMIRVRAARALREFKSKAAARHLVAALADTWRPNRSYISTTRQTAYVKDYDVEVAQTAFIADPVVDVISDGAVLEVAAISINRERRVYRSALAGIAGKDLGPRAAPWRKWIEAE